MRRRAKVCMRALTRLAPKGQRDWSLNTLLLAGQSAIQHALRPKRQLARTGRAVLGGALAATMLAVGVPAVEAAAPADLVVTSISSPPRSVATGAGFWVDVRIKNKGATKAKRSTTRFYLSRDRKKNRRDVLLTGSDTAPTIKPRKTVSRSTSVVVPAPTPVGPYFVIACADDKRKVRESNERNNCRASAALIAVSDAPAPGPIDPPPSEPAPPQMSGTAPTSFADSASFLYTGPNALQADVTPGAIDAVQAAVVRGRVTDTAGGPIAGVRVTVLDHPEFGRTATRSDGAFDMAVNGGGPIVLSFERAGYVPVQRRVDVPWQDYVTVDDVAMIAYDWAESPVDLDASDLQVVRGSKVSDADGTRQATLLFDPDTQATMTLPDTTTQVLTDFTVRATEYTVGASGPDAMPGQLPPSSAYTYATEFTIDEAVAAGATDVSFDQPVIAYLENFLDFPVGMDVPTGSYDREAGRWVPSGDGRIVKVLLESGGLAQLDTDGDGQSDTGLGIDDTERGKLAELYAPGDVLWRVPIEHFSPWDCNWPYGPPGDAGGPDQDPSPKPPSCSGGAEGCRIAVERQTLGEDFELVGTPFSLHYESERLRASDPLDTLEIPLSGSSVPASLKRIELEVSVAGRTFTESFAPGPNKTYTFEWDGRDAYGRLLQGETPITTNIGYVYDAVYQEPADFEQSFAALSGFEITTARARREITIARSWKGTIGGLDARRLGLGGMTLSVHHTYDPVGGVLYYGDGTMRYGDALNFDIASTVAGKAGCFTGSVSCPTLGDGGQATAASLREPTAIALAADGTLFIADRFNHRIRRVDPDGTITTVAGSGPSGGAGDGVFAGDGGPATAARLYRPNGVAVADDGSLYIADSFNHRIRKVDPSGTIQTIAGSGTQGFLGDGGPATAARMNTPIGVAIGPDGAVYFADSVNARVRRIENGTITTVVGGGTQGLGDGGPATSADLFDAIDIDFGPDGSLFLVDGERIRRVGIDGIITTIAGGGTHVDYLGDQATEANLFDAVGVDVAPDGSVYLTDGSLRVLRVRPDGIIVGAAGGKDLQGLGGGDKGPAWAADFSQPVDVEFGPDGSYYVSQTADIIRRVSRAQPRFSGGDLGLASEDGRELYRFDAIGRHLETIDTLTGATIYAFGYDGEGRLITITNVDGLVATVQRDASGRPTAIVAPGGQTTTLTLDTAGLIASIANPAGEAYQLSYVDEGLLSTLIDPRGANYAFDYDANRRLIQDTDRAGGVQTLDRTDSSDGFEVVLTSDLGRTTTYGVEYLDTGEVVRTRTDPSGAETTTVVGIDGTLEITRPDGTTETYEFGPDPRFGMHSPVLARRVRTTPGGITETVVGTRTAALGDPADPLSLQTLTDRQTVNNNRIYQQIYDAATRTHTETTPEGRQAIVLTFDTKARISQIRFPPADPTVYSYDSRGRLAKIEHGAVAATSRSKTFGYDAKDRLVSRTSAIGATYLYGRDDADRLSSLTLPSDAAYTFGHDANGNHDGVTMPSGAEHVLGYSPLDRLASYAAPGDPALSIAWDKDRNRSSETLPGGRQITWQYDTVGRHTGWSYPEATKTLGYVGSTDRLGATSRGPVGGGIAQTLDHSYDGDLLNGLTFGGVAQGAYTYTYDNNRFRTAMNLTSGSDTSNTALAYDRDGLVTTYGPFTFTHNGPGGSLSAISDSTMSTALTYDSFGDLQTLTQTVASSQRYREELTFDRVGRVSQKVESVGGDTHTYAYTYDDNEQLTEVRRDGTLVESYSYDDNRNRTSRQTDSMPSAEAATYDSRDRLSARGGTTYSFDVDGFLTQRGSDSFEYSAQGELLEATVGSTTVTYGYDAFGRRTSRTAGGTTHEYLYGNPDVPLQVTAVRGSSGVLTVLRYDDITGRLFALERGGTRYYVATDHLGSPHVITDAAGTVVKTTEYDSFGVQLADSNPSFDLPVGFAGGLADPETGLVRFGARDYEPASGRWTARDPILYDSGQGNLYAYVWNAPVDFIDRTGLAPDRSGGACGPVCQPRPRCSRTPPNCYVDERGFVMGCLPPPSFPEWLWIKIKLHLSGSKFEIRTHQAVSGVRG